MSGIILPQELKLPKSEKNHSTQALDHVLDVLAENNIKNQTPTFKTA